LATRFGVAAVDLIAKGEFGKMVSLRCQRIESVDFSKVIGRLKTVKPHGELVSAARAIGMCFGD
jgi:6-phosphofructokinase 1